MKLKPKGTKKTVKGALKKIKAYTKRGRKVTATITVKLADTAGHTRTVKRTVRLTR